jgi:hypothetical protein
MGPFSDLDAPNDEVCFWRRLTNNGRPRETAGLARGQFSGVLIQSRETNLKAGAHAASTEGQKRDNPSERRGSRDGKTDLGSCPG